MRERFAERAAREGFMDVAYTYTDSPIGRLLLASTERGLVRLIWDSESDAALQELADRVSPRVLERRAALDRALRELDDYWSGRRTSFDVPVDLSLSSGFNNRVQRMLLEIPFGGTVTYGELAARAGSPRGARAVGNAVGSNPVAVVVPCHRVRAAGGKLGGYGGGLDRKRYLLSLEGVR